MTITWKFEVVDDHDMVLRSFQIRIRGDTEDFVREYVRGLFWQAKLAGPNGTPFKAICVYDSYGIKVHEWTHRLEALAREEEQRLLGDDHA